MVKVLFILSGLCFSLGIFASIEVTTTFQQVIAGVSYICAAILLVGAAIVKSVEKLARRIEGK
jgi:tetrahydromethanopterin S-methyltransferase subunit E